MGTTTQYLHSNNYGHNNSYESLCHNYKQQTNKRVFKVQHTTDNTV